MKLQKPEAEKNGFVKTLNNMGYMTSTVDPLSESFVEYSKKCANPVLDIGAAYGIATKKALLVGANVIANDIEEGHLQILSEEVSDEERKRLTLLPGDLNHLTLKNESVSAVLVCRVLHFFNGSQIEAVAKKIFDWLVPSGRVFIVAETPYLNNFRSFIPEYEKRKLAHELWPGFIVDVMAVAPERGQFLPKQMHLLDPEVLRRVFESAGFKTVECKTIPRLDFPIDIQLDGRESVGYIGEK